MKTYEQKKREVLSITDPRKAYIKLATDKGLKLDEKDKLMTEYLEKYKVEAEEMAFYPNGERVLTPEMFWKSTEE